MRRPEDREERLCEESRRDFSDLRAVYINCTLKRSPEISHTQGLAERSTAITQRLARMLKDAGGFPAHGNQRSVWDAGCRLDFANPDYR